MRTSFSWLFVPSLTLSLPFSLSAATTNLSSQNSFNGTGTFSPTTLNDSTEDILNFLGDVSISNAGSGTALTASCFGQTAGDFTLQGNGFSLSFNSITAQDSVDGVAISATATNPGKALSLLGFSNLFFYAISSIRRRNRDRNREGCSKLYRICSPSGKQKRHLF